METIDVHEAQTQLFQLIERVAEGDEVEIVRDGEPVARLVPSKPPRRAGYGSWKGLIDIDDRFFEPLPEEELAAWEGRCSCDYCSTHTL